MRVRTRLVFLGFLNYDDLMLVLYGGDMLKRSSELLWLRRCIGFTEIRMPRENKRDYRRIRETYIF